MTWPFPTQPLPTPPPASKPFDTHAAPGQSFDTHSRTPQQEPYCWMSPEGTIYQASDEDVLKGSIPMYLGKSPAQPSKPWAGLTDEEMNAALDYWSEDERSAYGGAHAADGEYVSMIDTWRYIEAKLREKNT